MHLQSIHTTRSVEVHLVVSDVLSTNQRSVEIHLVVSDVLLL